MNGLAIAGFVCSLVGLFSGGFLSPVGLILSLVALGREPKGFAIAGLILGLLGTCGWLIAFLMAGAAILAFLGLGAAVATLAITEPDKVELTADAIAMTVAIEERRGTTGTLPASIDEVHLDQDLLTDPWGNEYRYVLDPARGGYRIMTDGPDGRPGTDDDINVRDFQEVWEAEGSGSPPPPRASDSQDGSDDGPPTDDAGQ
jgi:hypothetical protein